VYAESSRKLVAYVSGSCTLTGSTVESGALSQTLASSLLLAAALALEGCWTAPVANVQPKGEARLIQSAISVESVKAAAIVESVDRNAGTIVVRIPGAPEPSTYKVGHEVENFSSIQLGNRVKATVKEELSVYVLRDGQAPGADGAPEKIAADARVLSVDPSYRLLKVQYSNGGNETFKVAVGVKLNEMEAGDAVVIRPVEAVALQQKR
jgi:hypothetical protein